MTHRHDVAEASVAACKAALEQLSVALFQLFCHAAETDIDVTVGFRHVPGVPGQAVPPAPTG